MNANLPRKEFYFIRHAETDVNANPHLNYVDDLPLNAKGRIQAQSVTSSIQALPLKSVCFSPLKRAKETKEILTKGLQLNQIEINNLAECGSATWLKMVRFERRNTPMPQEVSHFLSATFQGITQALGQESPLLIVAHGGVHWAVCYFMNIKSHPWKIRNCQLVHFLPIRETEWRAEIATSST